MTGITRRSRVVTQVENFIFSKLKMNSADIYVLDVDREWCQGQNGRRILKPIL